MPYKKRPKRKPEPKPPDPTPKPPRKLAGAALGAVLRAMDRVELPRVRGESKPEHRAFLLWAMADGLSYPNHTALLETIAATCDLSPSNTKLNYKNRRWAGRLFGHVEPQQVAYVTWRRHYMLHTQGADILALSAVLDPPPTSVPELWKWTATRIAQELQDRRDTHRQHREKLFGSAVADATPITQGGNLTGTPDGSRSPVDIRKIKPAKGVTDLLSGGEQGLAKMVADAVTGRPATRGARMEARVRAKEAVNRAAKRVASNERRTGERVVLDAQDLRNLMRSVLGTPIDETTLRQVDRELLEQARQMGAEAEARFLSLVATQRTEAENTAADSQNRMVKLIDSAFGYFVQEMKAGRVRVTMSSLPALIRARQLLTGEATDRIEHGVGGQKVRDSARVADARATGDQKQLLLAMREDAAELSMILNVLSESTDTPSIIEAESSTIEPDESNSDESSKAVGE